MRYKPDWDEAKERLTALWEGRALDRPCLAVKAPRAGGVSPAPAPVSAEQRWLDQDWMAADLRCAIGNTYWGGEAIPSYLLLAGWLHCYGAIPHFEPHTIWHEPINMDYDSAPAFRFDMSDPWAAKHEALYRRVLQEAGKDDFLVGQPLLLPGNDLLAAILGTEEMFMTLMDHAEWAREAILQIGQAQIDAFRYYAALAAQTHDFPCGNAGWMPFWAPQEYRGIQSDISCMLSVEMFDEFVLPELQLWGAAYGNLWYHLDGENAKQHLPRLCELPAIRVIQYVPTPSEPANGPEHLEMYRTMQRAGKIVHIEVPVQHVEPLVKSLDPSLLCLETWVGSPAEAEELLTSAIRWTAEGCHV